MFFSCTELKKRFRRFFYPFFETLDAFRNLRNLFWGFGKTPPFLQCTDQKSRTILVAPSADKHYFLLLKVLNS